CLERLLLWPVFSCPSMAGFGCPPRRGERTAPEPEAAADRETPRGASPARHHAGTPINGVGAGETLDDRQLTEDRRFRVAHFPLSRSSSYGADVAMLVMSPMAGSATRGPNAPMPACSHSGAYMTFS